MLKKPEQWIVATYLVVGVLWILFSDDLAVRISWSPESLAKIQSLKGCGYVAATALALYYLIRRGMSQLRSANNALTEAYDKTIRAWIQVMDLRHGETHDHALRVTAMAMEFARIVQFPTKDLLHFERGAILHDIGKIGIPDSILIKPGPLTPQERTVVQTHPVIAMEFLNSIEFLRPCQAIPYCHHERWDGTGYPRKLKALEIPLEARLFAIVDVWDALISDRVYRRAWPEHDVLQYLQHESGKHFDPELVAIFLANRTRLEAAATASTHPK